MAEGGIFPIGKIAVSHFYFLLPTLVSFCSRIELKKTKTSQSNPDRSQGPEPLLPLCSLQGLTWSIYHCCHCAEELPADQLGLADLPSQSTARQTVSQNISQNIGRPRQCVMQGVLSCLTRMSDYIKDLTCFSSYDLYSKAGHLEERLVVSEIFQKYLLRNNEPFLFYCRIPAYTK